MNRVLKLELRKLFRSKGFWVSGFILIAIIIISFFTITSLEHTTNKAMEFGDVQKPGLSVELTEEIEYSGKYFLMTVLNGQLSLILSVFIPLFIAIDFSQGTIRNTVAKGYSRGGIMISKIISSFLATVIIAVISLILAASVGTAKWGFGGGKIDSLLILTLGVQLLVSFAMVSLYIVIASVVRKTGLAIAISVIAMTVLNMICNLLDHVFHMKFKFSDYNLTNMMTKVCVVDADKNDLLRIAIVSIVYIACFSGISVAQFKKRDLV